MDDDFLLVFVIVAVCVALAAIVAIVILLLGSSHASDIRSSKREKPATCLIIAGSGGHTTEILRLMAGLSHLYKPRHFVIANTDKMSEEKIHTFQQTQDASIEYHIHKVPRSREVSQSWITSLLSTLYALTHSIPLVLKLKPDLVLCNGPGTCVPLVITAAFLRMLHIHLVKIIYVESICRVQTLSLSAKLVYFFCDHLLVQWPQLQKRYPGTEYIGRLV
ncbi:UDP-N-acetylglucosamine transferase subunit ALG14 homolog [Liolophura sinensis]|uniref:UDP-N-acetylglucosamine transferase subunit ALG14 homolog n=1 Tax=Liolophura sinensis TaxID=3198878 RepID=UPI00315824AC